MLRSQVEAVGRHLHPSVHPCLNLTVMGFGNPNGGSCSHPVMNLCNMHKVLVACVPRKKTLIDSNFKSHIELIKIVRQWY